MPIPDQSLFIVDRRVGEFQVEFDVQGTITMVIKAESKEAAKEAALAMCEDEDFGLEIDEASDVRCSHVWARPPMYLVRREGKDMKVSRLQEGDEPRQPTEYEARAMSPNDLAGA